MASKVTENIFQKCILNFLDLIGGSGTFCKVRLEGQRSRSWPDQIRPKSRRHACL